MTFKAFILGAVAINIVGALGTLIVFLGSGSIARALIVGALFYMGLLGLCLQYFLFNRSPDSAD